MKRTSILFLLSTLFLLFSFFVILAILCILFFSKRTEGISPKSTHYRFLKYNPSTDSVTRGFIIKGGNYDTVSSNYFYDSEADSHFLVAPFGSPNKEYKCSGTCTCEDSNRRNSRTLSRSLIFLASTLSSSVAVQIAKRHFEKSCEDQLLSVCDEVATEVNVCTLFKRVVDREVPEDSDTLVLDEDDELKQVYLDPMNTEDRDEEVNIFMCQGHCKPVEVRTFIEYLYDGGKGMLKEKEFSILRGNFLHIQSLANSYECEEMTIDMEIKEKDIQSVELATSHFATYHLNPFCKAESEEDVVLRNTWGPDGQMKFSMCCGMGLTEVDVIKNAECVRAFQ